MNASLAVDMREGTEEEPDPIFESSFLEQEDSDGYDDDTDYTYEENPDPIFECSSIGFCYSDDEHVDYTSDEENEEPEHFLVKAKKPKKFLYRLKDNYLDGGDFQSTEVEDRAMEWSAKLHKMNEQMCQENNNEEIYEEARDEGQETKGHEKPQIPEANDIDGLLEEAWEDMYTANSEETLSSDFLQGALVLHSEFVTSEQTRYRYYDNNTNLLDFGLSPKGPSWRQGSMTPLSCLEIKYGARAAKPIRRIEHPTDYRMKPTWEQRNLHFLFEFLVFYLRAYFQTVNMPSITQKAKASQLRLLNSPAESSDILRQHHMSLIPYHRHNQATSYYQWPKYLAEGIQRGFAVFYLMLMKHQVRLAEKKGQPRRQRIFLQRLKKALEDYPYKKPFDLLLEYAATLEALGELYRDSLHDYPQSFVYFTKALHTKSQLCGTEENAELASSLETLGVLARDKLEDQSDVAIRCLKQSLEMKYRVYFEGTDPTTRHRRHDREFLAEEYADVAQTLHSLGLSYDKTAQYEQAREYYQKALTMKRKQERSSQENREGFAMDEKSRKQLIATLFNLGCVSEKLSQLEEARSYFEEAMQLQDAGLNNGTRSKQGLIGTLVKIASIYERCHEMEGSYKYYKAALDIHYQMQPQTSEKLPVKSNPLLRAMLYGAGNVSNQLGKYEEALFAYESVLDILVKSESIQERRLLIPTLYNLAVLNDVLGRIDKASNHYRVCLDMMNRNTDHSLKESNQAMIIRMNILCLPDPLSDDAIPTIPVATTANINTAYHKAYEFYLDQILSKYSHQEYVSQDAALAVTIRNSAMLSGAHARNFPDARDYYQQFLEVVWYPHRTRSSNQGYQNARYTVAVQALHALGKAERKERNYSNARHYQNEALELLIQTKKRRLQNSDTLTPHQVRVLALLHTAIEREIELLDSGCCLLWVFG